MSAREARNAIVILLDSLNRHMLGAYGGSEFATPHIDRLATRSVRFTNHYAASLPCIPARHDILCGAWDFLWRPWGSVELWEDAITGALTRAGVVSQLISDHPHLFETGGENYHVDFTAWDYQRGHEGDPWKTRFDPSFAGTPGFGRPVMPYSRSRPYFRGEEDFPGPRTMRAAAHFLREDARAHDRFFLFVDEFDPHEPFDTPEEYVRAYDPDWTGEPLIWPPYAVGAVSRGVIDARQGRQIRARYGAKLTMIDRWLGKVLDEIDAQDLWDDTLVILCTDHGHYLGEKDIWGKPAVPLYQTMSHIPLLISAPGVPAAAKDALTTSVDIFATLAELFGVTDRMRQRVHGRSLLGLLDSEATSVREWLLAGVWGREVHYIDRNIKYARAPSGANAPLSMWSNRWSTMPTHVLPRERELPLPDDRAELGRMPGSRVPVIRQLWDESDPLPFWAYARFSGNHLYDLSSDPAEEQNLAGSSKEATAIDALRSAMRSIEAPAEQFSRLGLQ